MLSAAGLSALFTRPRYPREILAQMDSLGVESLSIVVLTGMFTGMVLALQSAASLDVFGARPYVGRLVCVSMVRELGPVLTALMVTGRVGSGMAAELGSMVVTQQIDALRVLGSDPMRKLVAPRLAAGMIMVPILTIISDTLGIFGGGLISVFSLKLSWDLLLALGGAAPVLNDLAMGLTKPVVFGFILPRSAATWASNHAAAPRAWACHHALRGGGLGADPVLGLLHDQDPAPRSSRCVLRWQGGAARRPAPRSPIISFRDVHLSFDRPDPAGRQLRPGAGHDQDHPGRLGLGEDHDPAAHPRPAEAGRRLDQRRRDRGRRADRGRDARTCGSRSGMVFQEGALFDSLTVGENVGYRLAEDGLAERGDRGPRARDAGLRGARPVLRPHAVRAVRAGSGGGWRWPAPWPRAPHHALRRAHHRPRPHHRHHHHRPDRQGARRGRRDARSWSPTSSATPSTWPAPSCSGRAASSCPAWWTTSRSWRARSS